MSNGNGTVNRIKDKASKGKAPNPAPPPAPETETEALNVSVSSPPVSPGLSGVIDDASARLEAHTRLVVNAIRAMKGIPPLADDETPSAAEIDDTTATLMRQAADPAHALNEAPDPQAGKSGNAQTIDVETECDALETLIRSQSGELLRHHVERGRITRRIINASLRKARNDQTRKAQRAAGLRAAELRALGAYDSTAESKPNPDRWNRLAALADLFPESVNLANVGAALELTNLLTRDDPPSSWDAPETWSLKSHLDRERVDALVKTAVESQQNKAGVQAAIETLYGAEPQPVKSGKSKDDPVVSAKKAATRLMGQINERTIDPATLFESLQSELERYGWRLTITRDAKGVETIKPVKVDRTLRDENGKIVAIPVPAAQ